MQVYKNDDGKKSTDVRRITTIVLIILGVQLIFATHHLIQRCLDLRRYHYISTINQDHQPVSSIIAHLVVAALSVVYILIFIFCVVKHIRIGVFIFAWLSIFQLIIAFIFVAFSIITIVNVSTSKPKNTVALTTGIVLLVLAVLSVIISILLIIYSFILTKYLKIQANYRAV